jgi:hypothetical protein
MITRAVCLVTKLAMLGAFALGCDRESGAKNTAPRSRSNEVAELASGPNAEHPAGSRHGRVQQLTTGGGLGGLGGSGGAGGSGFGGSGGLGGSGFGGSGGGTAGSGFGGSRATF